jgi:hypothetical protein
MTPAGPRAQARTRERDALRAAAHKQFAPLGTFASTAPREQLLSALKQLKPQLELRLRRLDHHGDEPHYQVEVETRDLRHRHLIDPWLGIKGALTTAFPAGKPGAVRKLQP